MKSMGAFPKSAEGCTKIPISIDQGLRKKEFQQTSELAHNKDDAPYPVCSSLIYIKKTEVNSLAPLSTEPNDFNVVAAN